MARLLEFLCTETWTYDPRDRSLFAISYHWFNLFEGTVWIAFGILVLRRFLVHRKSWFELAYVAAFVAFGLTDFREAWSMPLWLLFLKLLSLIALFRLRQIVMRRFYPQRKVY